MNNVWKPEKQRSGSNIRAEGGRGWDSVYKHRIPSLSGKGGAKYDANGDAKNSVFRAVRQDMMPIFIARKLKNECDHVAGNKWCTIEDGKCRVCGLKLIMR